MFSSNQFKFLLFFALLVCHACSYWQSKKEETPTRFSAEEFVSNVPFSTKEPDVYQTEIVLTNYAGEEKSERKTFVARKGGKLRCDYESKISFLQSGASSKILIHTGKKIYAESAANVSPLEMNGESLQSFLSSKWLNEKADARFENLGAENNLTKYRVVLNETQLSEMLIYVDENFKIPVRQEFYSIVGEQKKLVFSVELRNLKLETNERFFELPKDYKKVLLDEFQKTMWKEKFDAKDE
jgi:outer membrane lipoprotein-sorting protein